MKKNFIFAGLVMLVMVLAAFACQDNSPGVVITSPTDGSTISSPATVIAKANSSHTVTTIKTYVDGNLMYTYFTNNGALPSSINKTINMSIGKHHLEVRAWDNTNATYIAGEYITVASQPPPVAISVTPSSAFVGSAKTVQLSATVQNAANTTVAWTASIGTVSSAGLYTAPTVTSNTTATVTATSVQDPTKKATSTITIVAAANQNPVVVSVSPSSTTVSSTGQAQFTASVVNAANPAVTWGTTAGTITSGGLFTAPAVTSITTVSVKATSVQDPTKSASAAVTVNPPQQVGVVVTPTAASIFTNSQQTFSATVSGSTNTAVTWWVNTVQGGNATVGTVTSGGVYTAPATVSGVSQVFTVKAVSAADPSKSASAQVTVNNVLPGSVNLVPSSVSSLQTSKTQQFLAEDSTGGAVSGGVNWFVNNISGGNSAVGTVSVGGLYTAPLTVPSPATVTVKAVSILDPTKFGTAPVTIVAPPAVTVAVSPASASLFSASTQQFNAQVANATDTSVTWSANNGTISSGGLFTAPTVSSTTPVTVTATSNADNTKHATASVTVNPVVVVGIQILPSSATIVSATTQQFTAQVSGTSNTAVTWAASTGSITVGGLYTAPTVGVNTAATVTATSSADNTKTSTANITIVPPGVVVNPSTVTLLPLGTQQFSVTGLPGGTQVNWAASLGQITTGGLYTAPSVNATTNDTVTATSTTGSVYGTASVTIAKETLVPVLSVSPTIGPAPLAVSANSTASTDSGGTIVGRKFDWGDGNSISGQATASHTYTASGNYTVTLTLTGSTGITASTTKGISVSAPVNNASGLLDKTFTSNTVNSPSAKPNGMPWGSWRLWDTGANWVIWPVLETCKAASANPSDPCFNWSRLDLFLAQAKAQGIDLVYTNGKTPEWATTTTVPSSCTCATSGGAGAHACIAPDNLADFDNFIVARQQHVADWNASHAASVVMHEEVWNEPNSSNFWCSAQGGSTTASDILMMKLHQHVHDAVKASANPTSLIIPAAPQGNSVNGGGAGQYITRMFAAQSGFPNGICPYIDRNAFHGYLGGGNYPEILAQDMTVMYNDINASAGSACKDLPFWNTEGYWSGTTFDNDAWISRDRLMNAGVGNHSTGSKTIERHYWYQYGESSAGSPLPWGEVDNANSSTANLTSVGIAEKITDNWLIGAQVVTNAAPIATGSTTWTLTLSRPSSQGSWTSAVAVWDTAGATTYKPDVSYCGHLYQAIDGTSGTINTTIGIGLKPILLTNTGGGACGANPVSVSVTGPSSLSSGAPGNFTASVVNATNTAVVWSATGGTLSSTSTNPVTWTAPSVSTTTSYTIKATSVQDTTASGSATVSVSPTAVTVSVSPTTASLIPAQQKTFTATVNPSSSSTGITWAVNGVSGGSSTVGTITSAGLYTAPTVGATTNFTIKATSAPSGSSGTATATVSPSTTAGQTSQHVWVVTMENTSLASTDPGATPIDGSKHYIKNNTSAPYFNNTLLPLGTLLTNHYADMHDSFQAWVYLVSGKLVAPSGITGAPSCDNISGLSECNDRCLSQDNMVRQLLVGGLTWQAYSENLPSAGSQIDSTNGYKRGHNPLINFTDSSTSGFTDQVTRQACPQAVSGGVAQYTLSVPQTQLDTDLASSTTVLTKGLKYITPDMGDDMHGNCSGCSLALGHGNGSVTDGDTWLSTYIPKILARPEFQTGGDGVLLIVWDEGNIVNGQCNSAGTGSCADATDDHCSASTSGSKTLDGVSVTCGGHTAALWIGPNIKTNTQISVNPYTTVNDLATLCSMLQVNCPGDGATAGTESSDIFGTSAAPTLSSITVAPPATSIAVGSTTPFSATGHYSDGSSADITSTVTWSSLSPAIATISSAGLAKGVATGTSTIKAAFGTVNGTTTLTVTAVSGTMKIEMPFAPYPSNTGPYNTFQTYYLHSSVVDGFTPFLYWGDVETSQGVYDFSTIDGMMMTYILAGKGANLALAALPYGATNTPTSNHEPPAYIFNTAGQDVMTTCSSYNTWLVMFETPAKTAYLNFVKAVIKHYSQNVVVGTRGTIHPADIGYIRYGISIGDEAYFPCQATIQANYMGGANFDTFIKGYVSFMSSAVHTYATSLSVPFDINPPSTSANGTPLAVFEDQDAASYGYMFGTHGAQASDVANYPGASGGDWTNQFDRDFNLLSPYTIQVGRLVQTLCASCPVGGDCTALATAFSHCWKNNATGPLPPILSLALKTHTTYFEIYPADLNIALNPNDTNYACCHQAYLDALNKVKSSQSTNGNSSVFVSPSGNDANPGTQAQPVKSLDVARQLVTGISRTGLTSPIVVTLADGFYPNTGVTFTSGDSGCAASATTCATPVIYQAALGATPILSGGHRVTGWTLRSGTAGSAGAVWTVSLPAGTANFENIWYQKTTDTDFSRRLRPRFGATSSSTVGAWLRVQDEVDVATSIAGVCDVPTTAAGHSGFKCYDRFVYNSADANLSGIGSMGNLNPAPGPSGSNQCGLSPSGTTPQGDIELDLYESWQMERARVSCVDTSSHIIYLTGHAGTNTANTGQDGFHGPVAGHRYMIENIKNQLSQPGQWFLDRSTTPFTLSYIAKAGENPNNDTLIVPEAAKVMVLKGTSWIQFKGLTFSHDNFVPDATLGFIVDDNGENLLPAAVECQGCGGATSNPTSVTIGGVVSANTPNVLFDSDTFSHTSSTGMDLAYNGTTSTRTPAKNVLVQNSAIYDLGDSGFHLGEKPNSGVDTTANVVNNIVIYNNAIEGYSRVYADGEGIATGKIHDVDMVHNDIHDGYHAAISICNLGCPYNTSNDIGPSNNRMLFNHAWDIMQGQTADGGALYINGGTPSTSGINNKIFNNWVHDVVDGSLQDSGIRGASYGGHGIYLDASTGGVDVENNLVNRVSQAGIFLHVGPEITGHGNTFNNNVVAFAQDSAYQNQTPNCSFLESVFTHNIVYFDRPAANKYLFSSASCPTPASTWTFNNNDYYKSDGSLTASSTAWYLSESLTTWRTQSQDAASVVTAPNFVHPSCDNSTCSTQDMHLSGGQGVGFVPFDYTLAGRVSTPVSVPSVFATRPIPTYNKQTFF